eukprot:TRINITY_DN7644_c0_g1_i1.p1 TRINITY_DN7644_c0_g1~~TRINITY_DN7644_c0_g1_i1.p1  ORF type:complete len:794 (-),score=295.63 TRINITY_DN7644_c0_g1_i1:36-2417(-)
MDSLLSMASLLEQNINELENTLKNEDLEIEKIDLDNDDLDLSFSVEMRPIEELIFRKYNNKENFCKNVLQKVYSLDESNFNESDFKTIIHTKLFKAIENIYERIYKIYDKKEKIDQQMLKYAKDYFEDLNKTDNQYYNFLSNVELYSEICYKAHTFKYFLINQYNNDQITFFIQTRNLLLQQSKQDTNSSLMNPILKSVQFKYKTCKTVVKSICKGGNRDLAKLFRRAVKKFLVQKKMDFLDIDEFLHILLTTFKHGSIATKKPKEENAEKVEKDEGKDRSVSPNHVEVDHPNMSVKEREEMSKKRKHIVNHSTRPKVREIEKKNEDISEGKEDVESSSEERTKITAPKKFKGSDIVRKQELPVAEPKEEKPKNKVTSFNFKIDSDSEEGKKEYTVPPSNKSPSKNDNKDDKNLSKSLELYFKEISHNKETPSKAKSKSNPFLMDLTSNSDKKSLLTPIYEDVSSFLSNSGKKAALFPVKSTPIKKFNQSKSAESLYDNDGEILKSYNSNPHDKINVSHQMNLTEKLFNPFVDNFKNVNRKSIDQFLENTINTKNESDLIDSIDDSSSSNMSESEEQGRGITETTESLEENNKEVPNHNLVSSQNSDHLQNPLSTKVIVPNDKKIELFNHVFSSESKKSSTPLKDNNDIHKVPFLPKIDVNNPFPFSVSGNTSNNMPSFDDFLSSVQPKNDNTSSDKNNHLHENQKEVLTLPKKVPLQQKPIQNKQEINLSLSHLEEKEKETSPNKEDPNVNKEEYKDKLNKIFEELSISKDQPPKEELTKEEISKEDALVSD